MAFTDTQEKHMYRWPIGEGQFIYLTEDEAINEINRADDYSKSWKLLHFLYEDIGPKYKKIIRDKVYHYTFEDNKFDYNKAERYVQMFGKWDKHSISFLFKYVFWCIYSILISFLIMAIGGGASYVVYYYSEVKPEKGIMGWIVHIICFFIA